jgi:hypothetical protein
MGNPLPPEVIKASVDKQMAILNSRYPDQNAPGIIGDDPEEQRYQQPPPQYQQRVILYPVQPRYVYTPPAVTLNLNRVIDRIIDGGRRHQKYRHY